MRTAHPGMRKRRPYVFCVTSPFSARARRIFWVAVFGTAPFKFDETSTAPKGRFIWRIGTQCAFVRMISRPHLRVLSTGRPRLRLIKIKSAGGRFREESVTFLALQGRDFRFRFLSGGHSEFLRLSVEPWEAGMGQDRLSTGPWRPGVSPPKRGHPLSLQVLSAP